LGDYDVKIGLQKAVKNSLSAAVSAGIAWFLVAGNYVVEHCPDVAGHVLLVFGGTTITVKVLWDFIANYLKHSGSTGKRKKK